MNEDFYDNLLSQAEAQGASRRRGLLIDAQEQNPDAYAKAARLGERVGLPAAVVASDPKPYETADRLNLYDALLDGKPVTQAWLASGDNAKAAHDDIQALSAVEGILGTAKDVAVRTADAYKTGQFDVEQADLGYRAIFGQLPTDQQKRLDELSARNDGATKWWSEEAARVVAQFVPSTVSGVKRGLQTGMAMGGGAFLLGQAGPQVALPEELVTVPAATATGFGIGARSGFLEQAFRQEAGGAYAEFRNIRGVNGEKLDDGAAKMAALASGLVNGSLELVGGEAVLSKIPGFNRVMGRTVVAKALEAPTVRTALTDLAKRYAAGISIETATEVAQEAVTILAGEIAKMASDGQFAATGLDEVGRRLGDVAQSTAKAMALLGLPGPAMHLAGDAKRIKDQTAQAQSEASHIQALSDAADQSKLNQRLPERFADFVEQTAEQTGSADTVYVPAEKLAVYFQGAMTPMASQMFRGNLPPDRAQLEAAFPDLAKSLPESLASGADVAMKIEDFMKLPSETRNQLIPEARLSPDGLSMAEVEANAKALPERLRQLAADLGQPIDERQAKMASEADQVAQDVEAQMLAAGQTATEAKLMGRLWGERALARAERLGQDSPLALYQGSGLEVTSNKMAPPTGAFQQPVNPGVDLNHIVDAVDVSSHMARGGKPKDLKASLKALIGQSLPTADQGRIAKMLPANVSHIVYSKTATYAIGAEKGVRKSAIHGLADLLSHATLIESGPNTKTSKKPDVVSYHRFYVPVTDGKRAWTVRIVAEQTKAGLHIAPNTFDVYDLVVEGKKGLAPKSSASTGTNSATPESLGSQPLKISIRQMLAGVKDMGGNPYFQPDGMGAARGWTVFSGKQTMVHLANADHSTFLHETGHVWLEELVQDASHPDASPQLKADLQTVLDWMGVRKGDQIQTAQHEQFARGVEAWVMEGKAPTSALSRVFSTFSKWLTRIYRHLTALDASLTADVRGVMDRLVATDAALEESASRTRLDPQIKSAEAAGLSPEAFDLYRSWIADAKTKAEGALLPKAMETIRRQRSRQWQAEVKAEAARIAPDLEQLPVYRAILAMTEGLDDSGPLKLSRESLKAGWGEDAAKGLKTVFTTKDGGVHPDLLAPLAGFNSGDELLAALKSAEPLDRAAQRLAEERLKSESGDPLADGSLREEALKALHNQKRFKQLVAERKMLERMRTQSKADAKAAKAGQMGAREFVKGLDLDVRAFRRLAADMLMKRPVRDVLNPAVWHKAEVKAAIAAEKAIAAGDWMEAGRQKDRQVLNAALYAEAVSRQESIQKALDKFADLKKSDEKLAKRFDIGHVDAARALLEHHGIGQAKPDFDLKGWVEKEISEDPQAGEELGAALAAFDRAPAKYRDLTGEEFQGLKDGVANLLARGRNIRRLEIGSLKIDRAQAVDELTQQALLAMDPKFDGLGTAQAVKESDKLKIGLLGVKAALTRVEHWARRMDMGEAGPFQRILVRPLLEQVYAYREAKSAKLSELLAILEPLDIRDGRQISAPELGYTFNGKGELLHAFLHLGNDSNKTKLLEGRGWSEQGMNDLMNRLAQEGVLTKPDFDAVQKLWDFMDGMKEPAQQAHKRMYGWAFDEIAAKPLETPFGTYKGGYAPAVTDSVMVLDNHARADAEALRDTPNASLFPTTGRGFTKGRAAGYKKPLALDIKLLPRHVDQVLRFTHIEPSVKALARVANDRQFRRVMGAIDPSIVSDLLIPWLQRTARQTVETPATGIGGRMADQFFRALRRNTAMQALAWNLVNSVQNLCGIATAATVVKPAKLAHALLTYAKSPNEAANLAASHSSFMRTRLDNQMQEMSRHIDDILAKPTTVQKMRQLAERHGYFLQGAIQNAVDIVTWQGAFDQAVETGFDEAQAAKEADSAVRRTQAGFAPEDISNFEAGGAFKRLFTMYYGFFNNQANLMAGEMGTALRKNGWAGGTKRLAFVYLWGFAVPAVLAEALSQAMKGRLLDDDEDDGILDDLANLFLGSQFRFLAAMVHGAGQVATGIVNSFNHQFYDDRITTTPVVSTVETSIRAVFSSVPKALSGDGKAGMAVRDALTMIGMLTGLPLGQLGKPAGYLADTAQGNTSPDGPLDVIQGLVSGREPPK